MHEGVLVGTRFHASVESLGHDRAKARIVAASGEETVRTSVFDTVRGDSWPDGITGRALHNDFTARCTVASANPSSGSERRATASIGCRANKRDSLTFEWHHAAARAP